MSKELSPLDSRWG